MDTSTTWLLLATAITAIILLYKYLTKNYGYWESQGVPFVKGYPIIGSDYQLLVKEMHEVDVELAKKFGRLYGSYRFGNRVLNVADPEIIKLILVKDFPLFINRQELRTGVKLMDQGITLSVDNDWKRIRSVISPTFSSGKMRKMVYLVKDTAKKLTRHFLSLADTRQPTHVKEDYAKFSLEVIGSCAFGIHFDAFQNPNHPFIVNSKKIFDQGSLGFFIFLLVSQIIAAMPKCLTTFKEKIMSPLMFFKDAAEEIIEQRRHSSSARENVDFLQLMLDAKMEESKQSHLDKNEAKDLGADSSEKKPQWTKTLDEDEVVAQCATFLVAGHDTVASALAFIAYNLACHPDVQDRLLREVDDTWEKYGDIDYDVVNKMPYLDAVISETLRLHTIGIRIMRQAKEDYLLPNTSIVIPKGGFVTIPAYALHHDPEFFPDPEKFDPHRFLPENVDKITPYSYLPFADGPRNCVAMRFAKMELRICFAYVLRYVKFSPTEKTMKPLKLTVGIGVLQPKNVFLKLEKRTMEQIL